MDKNRKYPLGFCKEGVFEELKLLFDKSRKRRDGVLESPQLSEMSEEQTQFLKTHLKEYVNSRVAYYDKNIKTK
jgi:hypothetical protein